jgi:hypothetical protein
MGAPIDLDTLHRAVVEGPPPASSDIDLNPDVVCRRGGSCARLRC